MSQRAVVIRNQAGRGLFGVLHKPESSPPGIGRDHGLLLLPAGMRGRFGPHRLYRDLTQLFLDRGMPVLRADFEGFGDSEGEAQETQVTQLHRAVALGRYLSDARAMLDWMADQTDARRFFVGGLCGGALNGMLLAQHDGRVAGLMSLGFPSALEGNEGKELPGTRGQKAASRRRTFQKMFSASAWWRLLTAGDGHRAVWRTWGWNLQRRSHHRTAKLELPGVPEPKFAPQGALNPLVPPGIFAMIKAKIPCLFIFGANDAYRWEFEELVLEPWSDALAPYQSLLRVNIIDGANHVLGDPRWTIEACAAISRWLDDYVSETGSPGMRFG